MRFWTESEDSQLTALYPTHNRTELSKILNRSASAIHNRTHKLGLTKEENSGNYKPGQTPSNKGRKQTDYMSTESIKRTKATRFKAGNKPHNYKPVGSTRINKDGYLEVKVSDPKTWMAAHRLKYQLEFGEIPKGYNVQFKDGNKRNLDISNLYLIDKAGNLQENTINRFPQEIRNLIYLKRKINSLVKKHGQK